jgi:hypothetical protein
MRLLSFLKGESRLKGKSKNIGELNKDTYKL